VAEPILYVISCLRIGGGERQLLEHLRVIDRRRWRPLLGCLEPVGELVPEMRALGIEPIAFPLKGDLERPNTLLQALRMARLCVRERVALVHAYDFWSNVLAVAAARLCGRKVIVSQLDQGAHLSRLQRRGQAVARRLATCVLVNAYALASELRAQGTPERKLRVLPQGIDLRRFDAQAHGAPGAPAQASAGPTVAVVANMSGPQKGHEDLLAAAALVPEARFLLVGDGAYRKTLELRCAARGLGDRVRFLGKRSDVPALLTRVSCLCHPSHAEGLPNAILEALAAGKPVVATDVGGVPELVRSGETGYLVRPKDPEALAAALRCVLADPAAARAMGRAGREHIERGFTIQRMAERHDRLYEELCARAA
jgi:glycosyltransferase involved in cell wall biosynthesis